MATIFWPSTTDGELVEVEFITLDGDSRKLKLLVDTGFTGKSGFVLPEDSIDLVRADYRPTHAVGALQGPQNRGWVMCCLRAISFRQMLIAIVADTSPLSLPVGVDGLAGLTFLRQFSRWGSELGESDWQFFVSDAS